MVKIKQAPLSARLGTGIGQGLGEQLPKEIERGRLAAGLRELEGVKDLSPFEQFSRLAAIPGITPQMIQSGAELLRQQGMLQGLKGAGGNQAGQPSEFSNIPIPSSPQPQEGGLKSITTPTGVEATRKPYIPMTTPQKQALARQLHETQPQIYPDFNSAIAGAEQIDAENKAINSALKEQRAGEQDVQKTLINAIDRGLTNYNAEIPGNIKEKLQREAFNELTEGKTSEEDLAAKYGKIADKISKDYSKIASMGSWSVIPSPQEIKDNIHRLRKDFTDRNDTKNFADSLMSQLQISPMLSYWFAEPVSNEPKLQKDVKSLPKLKRKETLFETVIPNSREKTMEISHKLAKLLGDKGSPLAVAQELANKGYDPSIWLNYLNENRQDLNLRESQIDQLKYPIYNRRWEPLNDIWLKAWSDILEE